MWLQMESLLASDYAIRYYLQLTGTVSSLLTDSQPKNPCTEGLFPLRKSTDFGKVMPVLWEVINALLFYIQSPTCSLHISCAPHFLHLVHMACALSALYLLLEPLAPFPSMDMFCLGAPCLSELSFPLDTAF